MKYKVIGEVITNMPWEDKPQSTTDIIWRYSQNPIIPHNLIPTANSIFNSAIVTFGNEYRGVFRCDDKRREMQLHSGKSSDGINWDIDHKPIEFINQTTNIDNYTFGYDPRVVKIGNKYWITWCNCCDGYTIGIAYTYDFISFYQMDNAFLPWNRNGVLFPRQIQGNYFMLSRPSDNGHTPFGNIFLSQSPDMIYWGKHRQIMTTSRGWQSTKIGAGPVPIETSAGWLLIYHGVLTSCNGFVYSFGAALLDIDNPSKVIARAQPYLMSPQTTYERVGDVPNVVFPCASLVDAATNKMCIYYGAADTVTAIAFTYVDDIIDFILSNNMH